MNIGLAETDITPEVGTALCGQPFPVVSTGVESPLRARALCLDDGRAPVLIASCDVLILTNDLAASVCAEAVRRTGVAADRIVLCATHTHSGPSTLAVLGSEQDTGTVEWGEGICEQSPFEATCVVELANGWNGYIPTREAFKRQGGYETKEVTSTMLVPEAGEIVMATVLGMLVRAHARD